jgi:class 3 adenylate cyclase
MAHGIRQVRGVTVNIAAQVRAHAAPNEILVSRTVRDLLFDSRFTFADRGDVELRGFDGT